MRVLAIGFLAFFTVAAVLGVAFSQGIGGSEIIPSMACVEELDLDVLIATVNEANLAGEIEGYLDGGAVCKFLGMALESTEGNGDRLYYGCAAFLIGTDWDALKWDYEYDESSSQGQPSVPQDVVTDRTVDNPTGTSGLGTILSDRLSWDYLVHVCNNCPVELRDELDAKTLIKVWVEHETGAQERVWSFWLYDNGSQSKTWKVWSTVTNGQFGSLNVD